MFFTRYGNVRAENRSKNVEFGTAEALAGRGGGADGAVIFHQEQRAIVLLVPGSHVAFGGAQLHEGCDPVAQGRRLCHGIAIRLAGGCLARADDGVESALPQGGAHDVEQLDRKGRVGIGETLLRG